MPILLALLALLLAMLQPVPSAKADCPRGEALCNDDEPQYPSESQWERICSTAEPYCFGRQDGVRGELHTAKTGYGACGTEVFFIDEYVIRDLPPGTPVTCKVVVPLVGSTYMPFSPDSGFAIQISTLDHWPDGSSVVREFIAPDSSGTVRIPPLSQMEIPISVIAGDPFTLRVLLGVMTHGVGEATLSSALRFEDLPAGASVYGCKGFRQFPPLPARQTSWGALKSVYR